MPFSIQFIRGSLAGLRFSIGSGPLLVGRSHACAVRPKETDVSGRHLSLAGEGDGVVATILSAHRTVVAGARASQGAVLSVPPGTVVELGDDLAFRVVDDDAAADETSSLPEEATCTLPEATESLSTAATRFAGDDTGTLDATGTATAATRFGGDASDTGTVTASTRFGEPGDGDETSILGGATATSGESGESDPGETQVLQTQVASREELDHLKDFYEKKHSRRIAAKFSLLAVAALAAVGVSVYVSTRPPEMPLSQPASYDSIELLPALAPTSLKAGIVGSVGLAYPDVGATVSTNGSSLEIRTFIGRRLDVEVVVAADVFEDPKALEESREDTFLRYLSTSPELVTVLDSMRSLPDEDFFGGRNGQLRGIPCSRLEYWRMRGSDHVYGVVSFFRSGPLCCAVRREVPAAEKDRALWLLSDTEAWLWADSRGAFAAVQWEGAKDAGCTNPSLVLSRCEARYRLDSPAEWPAIEKGLRDVLAEAGDEPEFGDLRSRALKLLSDLRGSKVLHWKKMVAGRIPLVSGIGASDAIRASELDEAVRKDFPSPEEEWHFLARRNQWWE